MEYEKIKEWLDEHIKHLNNARRINDFNNQISANVTYDNVLIFKGIDIVADVMGLNLKESIHEDLTLQYEYSFTYNGITFVQYSQKRLEKYAGTD